EPAAALRALVGARETAPGPELGAWLTADEAQLRAAVGDVDRARAVLVDAGAGATAADPSPMPGAVAGAGPSRAPGSGWAGPEQRGAGGAQAALDVALARVRLRSGDPREAGRALPDWTGPDATAWPLSVRLSAGLLDAVLAGAGGDDRRAGRILEQVLDLAEPEGCRRVFTRAEPAVRDLLAAHLDSGTAHWPTVSDLVRGADERRADGRRADEPPERPAGPERTLDEPLTERELTILRYLQSILSNVEIASELSLSVNTVKTHVRNIYRKLDATRRREAVRRARELRLI
ncbi:helix-turn-helix transcriptional regulator, partial [Micromonospora chersina]